MKLVCTAKYRYCLCCMCQIHRSDKKTLRKRQLSSTKHLRLKIYANCLWYNHRAEKTLREKGNCQAQNIYWMHIAFEPHSRYNIKRKRAVQHQNHYNCLWHTVTEPISKLINPYTSFFTALARLEPVIYHMTTPIHTSHGCNFCHAPGHNKMNCIISFCS